MLGNGNDGDIPFTGPIMPKNSKSGGGFVFGVGLEDLFSVGAG